MTTQSELPNRKRKIQNTRQFSIARRECKSWVKQTFVLQKRSVQVTISSPVASQLRTTKPWLHAPYLFLYFCQSSNPKGVFHFVLAANASGSLGCIFSPTEIQNFGNSSECRTEGIGVVNYRCADNKTVTSLEENLQGASKSFPLCAVRLPEGLTEVVLLHTVSNRRQNCSKSTSLFTFIVLVSFPYPLIYLTTQFKMETNYRIEAEAIPLFSCHLDCSILVFSPFSEDTRVTHPWFIAMKMPGA